jgi:hypothetical protein
VGLEYIDVDIDLSDEEAFSASDTMIKAGIRYKFTRLFALGQYVACNGDDDTRAIVAFRWNFNDRD